MPLTTRQMAVLQRAHDTMSHAHKFIQMRERMHADGVELYEQDMEALRALIEDMRKEAVE